MLACANCGVSAMSRALVSQADGRRLCVPCRDGVCPGTGQPLYLYGDARGSVTCRDCQQPIALIEHAALVPQHQGVKA